MDGKLLARQIFLRTLEALDVADSVSRCVICTNRVLHCGDAKYDLHDAPDLRVVAVGKAAHAMLDGLIAILPADLNITGIVSAPVPPKKRQPGLRYFAGGHPTPNAQSLLAGEAALNLLRGCSTKTLVIVLLSGGGSALMEFPLLTDLSLADIQQLNRALVTCGAPITEINAVRKHVSAVKGGRLARAAFPAQQVSLLVSDVPCGTPDALASGPTMPDSTSVEDCYRIAEKHQLLPQFPDSTRELFERRALEETPKSDDQSFYRSRWWTILSNQTAVERASAPSRYPRQVFASPREVFARPVPIFLVDRVLRL